MYRLQALALILISSLFGATASAQDLMPPHIQQQLGLVESWARPLAVPYGAQSIAGQQLFVHQENQREYVEVVTVTADAAASGATGEAPVGKVLARIATDELQSNGQPLGRKEAERLANHEIRRLKRKGVDAQINVRTVPRVHMYTIGSDGMLEARDAETGQPVWMVRLGDHRLPYMALGVSEKHVTVINGANLLQVDAATGEIIVEVPMPAAPQFGATNAGDFAMIPMVGGGVQGYPLSDPTIDPFLERVAGAALSLPIKSPDSARTAWATDRGFVYVLEMQGKPSMLFRLKTDGIVSGGLTAASGDRFYFGSEAGQAYGMRATRSGKVLWSKPIGEPFYSAPLVVNDQVLIRSTYGNLFALHVDDGHLMWERPAPGIADMIGVLDGQLYAVSNSGSLLVVDVKTGERVASFPDMHPGKYFTNPTTNRLYLISDSGEMQCLRREDADLPSFNRQQDANPVAEEGEDGAPKPQPTEAPAAGDGTDPFGAGGTDPFGAGGNDPFDAAGDADPSGAAAGEGQDPAMDDPFAVGAGDAAEDPFGGQ
jgi:outer membrane protein assembly factor BamB